MLIRKKLIIMTVLYSLLFYPLVQAQQVVQKKLSELKEGTVFCYFTKSKQLTNSKANSYYYRKLIKKNASKSRGGYIVQDFYSKTDKKQVDPVIFMNEKDLYRFNVSSIDGHFIGWYINGKKEWEAHYYKEKLRGEYKEWYESGMLSHKSIYKNGYREGLSQSWDSQGNLIRREMYEGGRRVFSVEPFSLKGL